jgi:hypothetical protein
MFLTMILPPASRSGFPCNWSSSLSTCHQHHHHCHHLGSSSSSFLGLSPSSYLGLWSHCHIPVPVFEPVGSEERLLQDQPSTNVEPQSIRYLYSIVISTVACMVSIQKANAMVAVTATLLIAVMPRIIVLSPYRQQQHHGHGGHTIMHSPKRMS